LNNIAENLHPWQSPAFQLQINMPEIPRAFVANRKTLRILAHAVEEFGFEEQQVIYYYCHMSVPIHGIAWLLEMTELHVASVLGLYSERVKSLLDFFKKALPHDSSDWLDIKEILNIEVPHQNDCQ